MKKVESKKVVVAPAGSTLENKTNLNQLTQNTQTMKKQMSFEKFERFLLNTYPKITGKSFISTVSYISYLKNSIKFIGIDAIKFFQALQVEVKAWESKVRDNPAFISLPYEHRSDILSGYHAYITCIRYENGFITLKNQKQ